MAVAYVSDTGFVVFDAATTGQAYNFSGTQPSDGALIIAGGAMADNNASWTPSASDDQGLGNTYVLDVGINGTNGDTVAPFNVSNEASFIIRCENFQRNEGDSQVTVTITNDSVTKNTYMCCCVAAFSGAETSGALDVTASNWDNVSSVTSLSSGTTGTTARADSVAVSSWSNNSSGDRGTISNSSGFTIIGSESNGSLHCVGAFGYKILTTTGTQSCTWAWTGGAVDQGGACIAVYKGGATWTPQTSANETLHFTTSARW